MPGDLNCWNCDETLQDPPLPLSRHLACRNCFEFLHCCQMCCFFNVSAPGQCDHDLADPPVEKANANFCDYFDRSDRQGGKSKSNNQHARDSLDSLFTDEQQSPSQSEVSNDLDARLSDLFDDH